MELHNSVGWNWVRAVLVMATMVMLGIWVNSIFLLLIPMFLMHMFGHGASYHSRKPLESFGEQGEPSRRTGA